MPSFKLTESLFYQAAKSFSEATKTSLPIIVSNTFRKNLTTLSGTCDSQNLWDIYHYFYTNPIKTHLNSTLKKFRGTQEYQLFHAMVESGLFKTDEQKQKNFEVMLRLSA